MSRFAKFMAIVVLLCGVQGCAYFHNRAQDFLDMMDVGLTFSATPQIAVYYDFVPLVPIGYGDVDGAFVGIGGGQISLASPHRERSLGLILWGHEEVGFGIPDLNSLTKEEQERVLHFQRVGLVGLFQGPLPGLSYLISCPHYLHLAWIGAVASPRYLQALDFVLGWTTLDICDDDDPNRPLVSWPR
jgi:hypothetical protein